MEADHAFPRLPPSSILDPPSSFSNHMKTPLAVLALALLITPGCGENTAVSHGKSTALDSANLVEMTEDMTAKILADPEVQSELSKKGKLKIVIQPVENRMVGEVLPRGA